MADSNTKTDQSWSDVNKDIKMDALHKDGMFYFQLLVPGLNEKDLVVEAGNNIIEISGIFRNPIESTDSADYLINDITESDHWGPFTKSWEVDAQFDREKIQAVLKDGILFITASIITTAEKTRVDVVKR
jgi:HSP20 family molecular chaperone IbpA